MSLPEAVVARLSCYRRQLTPMLAEGRDRVYSHQLAERTHVTAAQVRRDFMTIRFSGSPAKGYHIPTLLEAVDKILGPEPSDTLTVVGVGQLGRALMAHFLTRQPEIYVTSAFDVDPEIIGTRLAHCTVRPVEELEATLREQPALVGVLAVPRPAAQDMADRLVACGVNGILNFASIHLIVPDHCYVEDVDIATSAEKALFFARNRRRSAAET